jgi:hypothetical protein
MNALSIRVATVVLAALLGGCGGTKQEEVASPTPETAGAPTAAREVKGPVGGYIVGLDAIAAALETVKDEATAKTAAVTITEVNARLQGLAAEMEKMPKMERGLAFAAEMQEMSRVQMRIGTAMQGLVAKPELMKLVSAAMRDVPKVQ